MTSWYFLVEKGKTIGPLEKEAVDLAIKKGRLGPFDLLYREGEEKWQPTHKFEEFRHLFQGRISATIDDSWIVLQKKSQGAKVSYEQKGPYLSERVKELLQLGEIQYSDFIWREGQKEWRRISTLDFFNPPPVKWKPAALLPQDVELDEEVTSGQGIAIEPVDLSAVTQMRSDLDKQKPKEAVTEDLTQTLPPAAESVTLPKKVRIPKGLEPKRSTPVEAPSEPLVSTSRGLGSLVRWPYVFLIAGFLILGGFIYWHRVEISKLMGQPIFQEAGPTKPKKVAPTPAPPAAPEVPAARVESPPVPSQAPSAAAVQEAPKPKVEIQLPKTEPSRLKIKINRRGSDTVADFSTDASFHFPIQVTVIGEAAEILGQVSVYRELTVKWQVNERPNLNLSKLGLGQGKYRIHAQIRDFEDDGRFRIGKDDRVFRAELDRHRKMISLPFQRERRRVILAGLELQGLISRAQSVFQAGATSSAGYLTWKGQLNDWTKRTLGTVNLSNPRTLVFPGMWLELGDLREDLSGAAEDLESGATDRVQKVRSEVSRMLKQINEFVDRSQKLSLFGRGG